MNFFHAWWSCKGVKARCQTILIRAQISEQQKMVKIMKNDQKSSFFTNKCDFFTFVLTFWSKNGIFDRKEEVFKC